MKSGYKKLSLTVFIFLQLSCDKNIDFQWKAIPIINKYNSLTEIIKENDAKKLVSYAKSNDKASLEASKKMLANKIAGFFLNKYKVYISEEFVDNPDGIILLGMFYAAKEYYDQLENVHINSIIINKTPDENMNCFLAIVSDVIGISQAKSIWASIVAGATEETIIATISLIGRRVAGILTIATMIYSTGECLGWW